MSFMAGSVFATLELDTKKWTEGLQRASRDLTAMGDRAQQFGRDVSAVGKTMTILGGAIVGSMALAVRAFGNFDAAMTESTAIMGNLSDDTLKRMEDAAKSVAKTTTFSAEEAAKSFFYLASAGLDAEQSIAALPIVSRFAQAGAFDMARATDLLTDAQSALGLTIRDDAVANMENMVRVSDALTKANILSNATVEQFSESLTNRAGAAMRMYNRDVEEGLAVLAAMADQGVKGAEAGTRLDIVYRDLQTRALLSADAFKKFNVTVFDANEKMRPMADIVADLENALDPMTDAGKRSALMMMNFSDRSVSSILNLMGTSEAIRKYEKALRAAGGTTQEVADKQLQTLNAQWKLTKNQLTLVALEIGKNMGPMLIELAQHVRAIAERVAAWAEEHPGLIKFIVTLAGAVGALLATLGPVVFVLGKIIYGLGGIAKGIGYLLPKLAALKAGTVATAGALAKIGLVGAAAFVGWKIGRAIGELTGLDKVIEGVFDKTFRWLGIIKEVNYEMGEGHAKAAEIQAEAIRQAMEITGEEVRNFIHAKAILQKQWRETGTTGNAALDAWLARLPPVAEQVAGLNKAVKNIATSWEEAADAEAAKIIAEAYRLAAVEGMKLEAAVVDGKEAFDEMAAAALEALTLPELDFDVDNLLEALIPPEDRIEVPLVLQSIVDEVIAAGIEATKLASVMTKTDIQDQIAANERALIAFGDNLPVSEVQRLEEEIRRLKEALGDVTPWERFLAGAVSAFQQIESMVAPIIAQFQRNKEIAIENEYKKRLDYINKTVKDEDKKQKAIMALEAEFEIKKTAARRAAAKTEKAVALMGAIINTAQAVTKALAQGGFILGIPWAAIIGAMGAVQIAAIAAQPIPLAEGATFDKPTLLTNVLTGENRPEHMLDEPRLIDIVRQAIAVPQFGSAPMLAAAGAYGGGAQVSVNITGPLISTTGISRQELWAAGEEIVDVVEYQLERAGRATNG